MDEAIGSASKKLARERAFSPSRKSDQEKALVAPSNGINESKRAMSPALVRFAKLEVLPKVIDMAIDTYDLYKVSAEQRKQDKKRWNPQRLAKKFTPVPALRSIPVVRVATGLFHTLLLTESSQVLSFGSGHFGQLGHGDKKHRFEPESIPEFDDLSKRNLWVADVGAGFRYSAVLLSNGELYTFGYGEFGELGHGKDPPPEKRKPNVRIKQLCLRPRQVRGVLRDAYGAKVRSRVTEIAAGPFHMLVRMTSSRRADANDLIKPPQMYSWGKGGNGQLGHGNRDTLYEPYPINTMRSLEPVRSISAGYMHSAVITDAGELWTWGRGRHGQLGYENDSDQLYPRLVKGLTKVWAVAVAAGGRHTAILTEDNDVLVFGMEGAAVKGVHRKLRGLDSVVVERISAGGQTVGALTIGGHAYLANCGTTLLFDDKVERESFYATQYRPTRSLKRVEQSNEIDYLSAKIGEAVRVEDLLDETRDFDALLLEQIREDGYPKIPKGFEQRDEWAKSKRDEIFAAISETEPTMETAFEDFSQRRHLAGAELAEALRSAAEGWENDKAREAESHLLEAAKPGNTIVGDLIYDIDVLAERLEDANKTLEMRRIFVAIDADGSGEIDDKEMKAALKSLGFVATDREVKRVMKEYDLDGDGTISEYEFIEYALRRGKNRRFPLLEKFVQRMLMGWRTKDSVSEEAYRNFISTFKEECVRLRVLKSMPPELKAKLCIPHMQPKIKQGHLDLSGC